MAKWNEVNDEEFSGTRERSRRYIGAQIIENVIRATLTSDILSEAAYNTIFSDKERLVEPTRDEAKKYFKDLRRNGNLPVFGIEIDGVMIDAYLQNMRSRVANFNAGLYRLAEFLIRQYDKEDPFCKPGSKATPEKVFEDFDISNNGIGQIPRFNRIIVGEINERLKDKIEAAEKYGLGEFFYQIAPKLGENIKEVYQWCWAFLVQPEPEKSFASSAINVYILDQGRLKSGKDNFTLTGIDRTVEFSPLKRPIDPTELATRTVEFLDFLESINPIFTPENLRKNSAERQSTFLNFGLAEYNLRRQTKADAEKRSAENKQRADERVAKAVDEERKRVEVELSDLRQKASEVPILKQDVDRKDNEIKAKDVQLAENDKEITRLSGFVNATSAKSLRKLKGENDSLKGRTERLDKEVETLEEENETAWKTVDELEEKLKRHESAVRGRKDPYFVLIDELDGTQYSERAHIYVTAIYHASKKGRVAKISMESLVKSTTGKLPGENAREITKALQELVDVGVYKARSRSEGPFTFNTKLEEITDPSFRKVVKKMSEMKAKGEI